MKLKIPESDTYFHKKKDPEHLGEIEFLIAKNYIKNYRTCLDIGAHVGVTTIRYAKYFKIVHSFEPLVHSFLIENTKHLHNVFPHNCAISDKNSTIEIYPNPLNSAGGIIPDKYNDIIIQKRYKGNHAQMPEIETVMVKCLPLDYFEFDEIDFIKIDVEGHIIPVIKGMTKTLTNNTPAIQMEMSAFEEVNTQVNNLLQDLGYSKCNTYKYNMPQVPNKLALQEWFYTKK